MCRARLFLVFLLCAITVSSLNSPGEAVADSTSRGEVVYVIPVEQTVERGLEAFLERSVEEAEEQGADHIIFDIDTPGGAVDAAGNIAKIFRDTEISTTAFVTNQAMSAGAFLALNADEIAMAPGTEMGAAQVIDGSGNAAGDKAQSAWIANMKGAAELNNRDPKYAVAMADPSVPLSEYRAGKGELLSLTADEAYEVDYAEYLVENREELLAELDLEDAKVLEADISLAEKIARFVTHPVIIPILLSVGSLGLIIELYSPGFGIPGILGAGSLFLFFFGHLIAGFAGIESVVLFIAGLVLILIELFVPGFGISGILGLVSVLASLFFASFSTFQMIISILVAGVVSTIAIVFLFKTFGKKGPMKKLVLQDTFSTDEGYVSHTEQGDLVGSTGVTLTPLRPSGSVIIGEERIDVVSEGAYVEANQEVKVVDVKGARVLVRHIKNE